MNNKLSELCNYYKSNKKKYLYSDTEIIDYFEMNKDEYSVNIKKITSTDNKILFFISKKNKLIYKGLMYESNEDISHKFNLFKEDLINLSLNDFIEKHYDKLKSHEI